MLSTLTLVIRNKWALHEIKVNRYWNTELQQQNAMQDKWM